jgi:hypothetical protein
MGKFSTKGVVRVLPSALTGKDGEQIDYLNEGLKQEADCGCGIDCCNNKLVLKDQSNTNTYELVFDGGVLKFRLHKSTGSYTTV